MIHEGHLCKRLASQAALELWILRGLLLLRRDLWLLFEQRGSVQDMLGFHMCPYHTSKVRFIVLSVFHFLSFLALPHCRDCG